MALITVEQYHTDTRDLTTQAELVSAALADAVQAAQERLGRYLTYGTYTETLYVYPNNRVYPRAVPLHEVVAPAGATIEGYGAWVGWFNPTPVINIGTQEGEWPPQATLTYKGGYSEADASTKPTLVLPLNLRKAICWMARLSLLDPALVGLPQGAQSASVGDVSVSGPDLTGYAGWTTEQIDSELEPYKLRQVRGWHQ